MPDSPNSTPVPASLVGRVAQGIRYVVTGVGPSDWFGPAQPMAPMAQDQALGRVLDYRVGYNLSLRPREDEAIGYHQLRALADACGVLRLVIETRKDQMERLTWSVQPRLSYGIARASPGDPRIMAAQDFLRRPDGHNGWATWLRQILEELLVTDAVALYRRRDGAGRLHSLQQIDGATVKRVIDESGLTPLPPDPAYQQILHGLPAVDYTADQLLYLPRNKRIHKLYGFSPVEQVVMIVNIALRRQVAQLNYFTEGNIPEALISCPPDWRPNQIREMQEIFDDMLRGNLAQRSGAKFVPGGLNVQFTKDALLKDEFDEWLARIICYAFSVPPTPFVKQTNRATADNASDSAMQEGLAPIQGWVKALIDRVLAEDFAAPDLEFAWNEDRALSPTDALSINTGYVAAGLKTRNEIRADLGLGPLPGGDLALVTIATGLAPIVPQPLGKDWHFDPTQPRDAQGRWTAGSAGSGGGDEEGRSGQSKDTPSGSDDALSDLGGLLGNIFGGGGDDSDSGGDSNGAPDEGEADSSTPPSSDTYDDSKPDDTTWRQNLATQTGMPESDIVDAGWKPPEGYTREDFDKLIPDYAPVELQDAIGKAEGSNTDARWDSTEGYGAINPGTDTKYGRYQISDSDLVGLGLKSGLGPNDWNTAFGNAYGIKNDNNFVPKVSDDFDPDNSGVDNATLTKAKDAQDAALAVFTKDLDLRLQRLYLYDYGEQSYLGTDGNEIVLNKGALIMGLHKGDPDFSEYFKKFVDPETGLMTDTFGKKLTHKEQNLEDRLKAGQYTGYQDNL